MNLYQSGPPTHNCLFYFPDGFMERSMDLCSCCFPAPDRPLGFLLRLPLALHSSIRFLTCDLSSPAKKSKESGSSRRFSYDSFACSDGEFCFLELAFALALRMRSMPQTSTTDSRGLDHPLSLLAISLAHVDRFIHANMDAFGHDCTATIFFCVYCKLLC
mmetsp:Transcript_57038/g.131223  ORF Transcript_57038/g.131223 Transcript_57038/m.131223 type:complete len:160 (+) Transcript_57038:2316-2795(+)